MHFGVRSLRYSSETLRLGLLSKHFRWILLRVIQVYLRQLRKLRNTLKDPVSSTTILSRTKGIKITFHIALQLSEL
jgi:hypothetical protein